jgi:transposase-like protein
MQQVYQKDTAAASQALSQLFEAHPDAMMPLLNLVIEAKVTLDAFIDVVGRSCLEAVLQLSAAEMAGMPHQGKAGGAVQRHGTQQGVVTLPTQKVRGTKPRLRRKGGGKGAEVEIPAYTAMQQGADLREKLATILLRGVSTRAYGDVIPAMAETCGVSRSSVSREFIEASDAALRTLCDRRFDDTDLLLLYIDGVQAGGHQVIAAIGVDGEGYQHLLGLAEGATENAVVVKGLLEDLVARGVTPTRPYLFLIDGSKALRAAVTAVFGADTPVQRCRHHKIENVISSVPNALKEELKCEMKAAYRLSAKDGMARLEAQADWRDSRYPSAASSLREGLAETFTINRLDMPATLRRCLGTTNLIESANAGMRRRTDRVTRWRNGPMVLRWFAAGYLETEQHFRRIMGYEHLWMLKAKLQEIRAVRPEQMQAPVTDPPDLSGGALLTEAAT